MATRFFNPIFQSLDSAGVAVTNGLLYFYEKDTTTKLDTFQDEDLTIPNTNPVETGQGTLMPAIWLQAQDYTVIFEIGGETVWSTDISGSSIPIATDTEAGIVELATGVEMAAGTATDKVPSVQTVTDFIRISAPQVNSGVLGSDRLPDATEAAKGAAEIATQTEVNNGADDSRMVTPQKLAALLAGDGVITDSDLSGTGYVEFQGGFKIQWGTQSVGANTADTITYPLTFDSFVVPVANGVASGGQNDPGPSPVSTTLSQLTVHNSSGNVNTCFWVAVGV